MCQNQINTSSCRGTPTTTRHSAQRGRYVHRSRPCDGSCLHHARIYNSHCWANNPDRHVPRSIVDNFALRCQDCCEADPNHDQPFSPTSRKIGISKQDKFSCCLASSPTLVSNHCSHLWCESTQSFRCPGSTTCRDGCSRPFLLQKKKGGWDKIKPV